MCFMHRNTNWHFIPSVSLLGTYVGLHLHCMCPGSRRSRCRKLDSVEGRFTYRLQAFHMTCQRRIRDIRWNDFITNRAVSDSMNLPSIRSTVAARRHSIFGHIRRLPDRAPAHMTEARREYQISRHTTPRLESPSW